MDTILLETSELEWLRDFISNGINSANVRQTTRGAEVRGHHAKTDERESRQLTEAIQAAFARLTLSLLSEPSF